MIKKSNSLIGRRVKLIDNSCMNAKVGSIAIIVGFDSNRSWVCVKWINKCPSFRQDDGAYYLHQFELINKQLLFSFMSE